MIYRNKRDQEAWLREKTLESLKANTFLQENDIVQVAEDSNFYKVVKTTTSIPLQNELFAQAIPSELSGNIATATKLKTPRNIALTGDVTGNANFDGSANISITSTVGNDSHTHSNSTITSVDASKVNTGVLNVARIPNLDASKIASGVLSVARIPNLDASKITSGTIDIARLPQGALERCVVVADDTARFKLTTSQVQQGDTVKVTATNKMYFVIDTSKLSTEAGYTVYTAGTATEVPWSGVTGKPSTFAPSSHTHPATQITQDATHRFVTDAEKTKWNGKADAHSHPYLNLAGGTLTGALTVNSTIKATGTVTCSDCVTTSDERLKKDIVKIDNALEKVNQLNGYTFLKEGDGQRTTGVLAQELLNVLPEAVFEREDGYYSVSYGNIVGLLIEAIKELQVEVKRLKGDK